MNTYFKAVRPDGLDFHSRTIDYGKAAKSRSKKIKHPSPVAGSDSAARYFSVATVPTDCTGFTWPARLFEVEPVGDVWTPHAESMPNKRAAAALKILRELPAWQLFGPNGEAIVAIIDRFAAMTSTERSALYSAQDDAFWRAWDRVAVDGRADRAGLYAARLALRYRLGGWLGGAAYGAALAVLVRDHIGGPEGITQEDYDGLSKPWRTVVGNAHPEDEAVD